MKEEQKLATNRGNRETSGGGVEYSALSIPPFPWQRIRFFGRKTKVPRHLAGCRESVSPSQQREGKNHCAKDLDWLNAARQR